MATPKRESKPTPVTAREFARNVSDFGSRAEYAGARFVVLRHERPSYVIIGAKDFEALTGIDLTPAASAA
jgi:PHD/YefM family antitoxin component YafN of YafNO toxin-antitoxin module